MKLVAVVSTAAEVLRPDVSFAGESAVGIHRATRNTLLGAIGAGVREMLGALTPYKTYAGQPRIALGARPVPSGVSLQESLARAYATERHEAPLFGLEQLARLLYFTNGDTGTEDGDPYKLRAAPSAGALYAGEIYVIALALRGIDPGVYYYDVGKHELVRVRAFDAATLQDAFEPTDGPAGAAALVCISNVFDRYEHRYSNRGYRYALVDTGHISENLRLSAAAAGVAYRALPRFCDDQLNGILGVDGYDEAVCAVHALGGALRSAGETPAAAASKTAEAPASKGHAAPSSNKARDASPAGKPSHAPASIRDNLAPSRPAGTQDAAALVLVEKGLSGAQVTKEPEPTVRYHDATKLVRAPKPSPRDGHRRHNDDASIVTTGKRVTLPSLDPTPAVKLEQCIVARRSPQGFATRAITLEQLGFVLRAAQPRAATRPSYGVELVAAVHRVTNLALGLYRYTPEEESLTVMREDDLTDTLPRACLGQSKAGDAAVGLLMIAHIRHAAAERGERAYRDLLMEAGEIAERIYLAADAVGLAARNLAAFLDDDLNELVGINGRELAVVHLTMLGHAA